MEECKTCELAVYCYSDSSTWIFRTKQEMDDKQEAMGKCPYHAKIQETRTCASEQCAGS